MGAFIGIIGFLGMIVTIIMLIVRAIRKKPKKIIVVACHIEMDNFYQDKITRKKQKHIENFILSN